MCSWKTPWNLRELCRCPTACKIKRLPASASFSLALLGHSTTVSQQLPRFRGLSLPRTLSHRLVEISAVPGGVLQTQTPPDLQFHRARSCSSHQRVPPALTLRPSLQSSSGDAQPPLRLPKPVLSPSKRHRGVGSKYGVLTWAVPLQHRG